MVQKQKPTHKPYALSKKVCVLMDSLNGGNISKFRSDKDVEFIGLATRKKKCLSTASLKKLLKSRFFWRRFSKKTIGFVIVENPIVYNILMGRNTNEPVTEGDTKFGYSKKFVAAITSGGKGSVYNTTEQARIFLNHF